MLERRKMIPLLLPVLLVLLVLPVVAQEMSAETEECIACHSELHPGLVASWEQSRHSRESFGSAMTRPALQRRVSAGQVDQELVDVIVGCYECHSLNSDNHADAFEHNGYWINVVVSSRDCGMCHPVEVEQYDENIMSHAYANLTGNSLYRSFMKTINCNYSYADGELVMGETAPFTEQESCLYCHGTEVTVNGTEIRETGFGELEFPVLTGWPNQGVGRINPDGSRGACTSCHPRHDFSIKTAREPYTCSECHKGPDVPASKVYEVSKHGHIVKSQSSHYDYDQVPWQVGRDFTAPTCAACHVSLLTGTDGSVIAPRTHQFSDRLAWRLFGVPYAHPHPLRGDLSGAENAAGLPLMTELDGSPVSELLVDGEEQHARTGRMKSVCSACHSSSWVDNHFLRLDHTIAETNRLTLEGTRMMSDIWEQGGASGLPQGDNIFDEEIERVWTSIWLFHANSIRFSSAMAGGGDYGVFANGRYQLTEQLFRLQEELEELQSDE